MTFQWKDYADYNQTKTMTLDAVEFMRRFLLHVLPRGFVAHPSISGFLSNRVRKEKVGSLSPLAERSTDHYPSHACSIGRSFPRPRFLVAPLPDLQT